MSTLEELEKRVSKLEQQINHSVSYQIDRVCEQLNVSKDDVWVHRLGSPIHQEARDRTWYILHFLGRTIEEIAVYTGYSDTTIQRRLARYKEYLREL